MWFAFIDEIFSHSAFAHRIPNLVFCVINSKKIISGSKNDREMFFLLLFCFILKIFLINTNQFLIDVLFFTIRFVLLGVDFSWKVNISCM